MTHQYLASGWTPICSEDVPKSLDEFYATAEELFDGDNFQKICDEALAREAALAG